LENIANEEMIVTQEESEKDDEIVYKHIIDGQTVSWAKTTLFNTLNEIHTACKEKRKGHGSKLLTFIEKNAKTHCSTLMIIVNLEYNKSDAINFFKKMGYEIDPDCYSNGFLKATKILSDNHGTGFSR
jgi:GNAT superfamily N-acetyltransferase